MSRTTNSTATTTTRRRTRTAVIAAGVCASVAMGVGGAVAAEAGAATATPLATETATTLAHATGKQASAQAAAAKADKDKKKADEKKAKKNKRSWVLPVAKPYELTASFAQAGGRWMHKHSGQDFAVPVGTPVHAVHGGTVVTADWGGSYGWNVVIKHKDGRYSQYGHLSKFKTHVGDKVKTGEVIAKSGNTGNTSGPHVHFEIRNIPGYGDAINPVPFLDHRGAKVG